MKLAGRTILVTGASRGIGRALVEELVEAEAARVIAVARDAERLGTLGAAFPGRVEPIACDLGDRWAVAALATRVRGMAPDLSVLINNAGVQRLTDLIADDAGSHADALAAEIDVNFTGAVVLICALMPHLLAQADAMVVNVTSGLALAPKQSAPVYCATKAGMRSFTMALRAQADARAPQLKVMEALPPLVDTDMTAGRGRGKISPQACAREIVAGMQADRARIYVGKAKLLRAIFGLSPSLAARLMRDG